VRARGFIDPSTPSLSLAEALTVELGVGGGYKVSFSGVVLNLTASTSVEKAGELEVELGTNGSFGTSLTFSL